MEREEDAGNAEEQWVVWSDLTSEAEWAIAELIALAALPPDEKPAGRTPRAA